jgi:hypothetical protein
MRKPHGLSNEIAGAQGKRILIPQQMEQLVIVPPGF